MDAYRKLLAQTDPEIYDALVGEEKRQAAGIELIPSENYCWPEVLVTLGSVFTNKYSEGYPGRRYYGGQEYTDVIETLARDRAKELFGAEHANVQPLSGAAMNAAVYLVMLEPGDTVLGMDLSHGGHLTHGAPVSHMGKLYNWIRYKSDPANKGAIDFEALRKTALESKPKMIVCGFSSYPRDLDYAQFKAIADEVGALTMADISHIGGLVAGGALNNPVAAGFDFVTTTTHKSLRGPRGGLILCKEQFAKQIDKSVFPGLQGGPHMNAVAGIAITMGKALQPEWKDYCRGILANAQTLAKALVAGGADLVTGGTDNHMMVVDCVTSWGFNGKIAEEALDRVNITCNKQVIPDDPNPPLRPSGIRLGTPAATTRGFGADEMNKLGAWMVEAMTSHEDEAVLAKVKGEVEELCSQFPVPGVE
ncbi:MAG: aminotransferase class I/II-fold pyridoxal phosphate-dependent enzyme [Acidobacteria bacterium]|nr:aminotransferase class I/II-fold pyridoxal phosphate-dependent enzyme [Acidobacteriota bacterium]